MGAVFYDRRGVTGIDSAAHPLALRACHVSVRTSTKHAYAGAEDGEQKVLPTQMCGSNTKAKTVGLPQRRSAKLIGKGSAGRDM